MATTLETFALDELMPAQNPQDARTDAFQLGASLTLTKGTAMAIKTSDNKAYPLNTTTGTNEVQTLNFTNSPAGTFRLGIVDSSGVVQYTQRITYSATIATLLANLQAATDAVLASNAIVWSGTLVTAVAGTFSGTGYAALPQTLIVVDSDALTAGDVDVTRTTAGGITDGTQNFKFFLKNNVMTDSSSKVYLVLSGSAAASYRVAPQSTATGFISGVFDPQDVQTKTTPTQEVDTFTPTNPTTSDVYKITITYPDLTTYVVTATVGATQTATAIVTLLKTAWAADATAAAYATASGTATLILTGVVAGNALNLTGSVVGTGTIAKVVTTAAAGRTFSDIRAGAPGATVLANGFWRIP